MSSSPSAPSPARVSRLIPAWLRLVLLFALIALGATMWALRAQIHLRSQNSLLQAQNMEIELLQSSLAAESTIGAASLAHLRHALRGGSFTHHGKLASVSEDHPVAYLLWSAPTAIGFLYTPSAHPALNHPGVGLTAHSAESPREFALKSHSTSNSAIIGISGDGIPHPVDRLEWRDSTRDILIGTVVLQKISGE